MSRATPPTPSAERSQLKVVGSGALGSLDCSPRHLRQTMYTAEKMSRAFANQSGPLFQSAVKIRRTKSARNGSVCDAGLPQARAMELVSGSRAHHKLLMECRGE